MRSIIEIHLLVSMCPIHPAFEVFKIRHFSYVAVQYYPDNITILFLLAV